MFIFAHPNRNCLILTTLFYLTRRVDVANGCVNIKKWIYYDL